MPGTHSTDTPGALTPDDIDDLARRAQDGDRDALEDLLAAVRPRALNVCRGVLPYSSDAEDACQEALINIARKIGSWGGRGRFTTWVHVVAVNSVVVLLSSAAVASHAAATASLPVITCSPTSVQITSGACFATTAATVFSLSSLLSACLTDLPQ